MFPYEGIYREEGGTGPKRLLYASMNVALAVPWQEPRWINSLITRQPQEEEWGHARAGLWVLGARPILGPV